MINRAKMPRQLRNKGGITSIIPREKYGIGSDLKDFVRDIIPNELADVAVKAAPLVAPFYPGTAALMRGIGRFDQRGSISDAIKQGTATYAFGKVAGKLGGAESGDGFFGGQTYSREGFMDEGVGRFFKGADPKPPVDPPKDGRKGFKFVQELSDATINKVPILKDLPPSIQDRIVFGGITSAASYVYEKFIKEEPPQEEGETMEQYLARRKENVGRKMRTYFDNYFSFDKEYSQLDDAGRDAFVARYNLSDGGRIGYQAGGISSVNTLAENIRRNRAAQAAFQQSIEPARKKIKQKITQRLEKFASKAFPEGKFKKIKATSPTQKDYNIKATEDLVRNLPGGVVRDALAPTAAAVLSLPYDAIQAAQRMNPKSGISGFIDAFKAENPMSSLKERTIGAAGPLAERLSKINLGMSQAEAAEPVQNPTTAAAADTSKLKPLSDKEKFRLGLFAALEVDEKTGDRLYDIDKMYSDYLQAPGAQYFSLPEMYDRFKQFYADGGMPTGIMRTNKAGIKERDYRETGGFVPVGIKEKADDVPAMLSKNEFVFTADAVRGAGNGSIEKGAQRMYDTMKRLEKRVT
jgi:hypothetical protein